MKTRIKSSALAAVVVILAAAIPSAARASVEDCFSSYYSRLEVCDGMLGSIARASNMPTTSESFAGALAANTLGMLGVGPYQQCAAMAQSKLYVCITRPENIPPQTEWPICDIGNMYPSWTVYSPLLDSIDFHNLGY
jgi:hypothetical protein